MATDHRVARLVVDMAQRLVQNLLALILHLRQLLIHLLAQPKKLVTNEVIVRSISVLHRLQVIEDGANLWELLGNDRIEQLRRLAEALLLDVTDLILVCVRLPRQRLLEKLKNYEE